MPLTQVSGGGLADDSVSAAKIATGAVTAADITDGEITGAKIENDVALGGNPTTTTQTAGNNSTRIATTAFVTTAVGNIPQDSITEGNTTVEVVDTGSDGHITFDTEGDESMRIDTSGRLLVGTTSVAANGSYSQLGKFHLQGNTSSSSGSGIITLRRGEAPGSITNSEDIGVISFAANDNNEFAWIRGQADGGAGTNDYPGRLSFSTTADGASSPTERMRINSSGQVGMGTAGINTAGSNVDVTVRMTPATSNYGLYASNFSSGTTATPGGYGVYGHMGGTPPSGQAHYGLYGKVDTHSSRASGGLLAYSINNSIFGIAGYWSTAAYYGFYSNGSVYAAGGFSSSDSRLKDIVSDGIGTGILDKVCKLQAKRFTWKDNTLQRRSSEDVLIGLLAQDVQTDFPEVVASVHQTKITGVNPETLNEQLGDNLAIDYGKLVPVLVEALKEAKTRIETLEAEVAALKSN